MPTRPVYLDYHATTPTDPRVVEAMLPYFTTKFGNAGSAGHAFGWEAADALDLARNQVAALIGATPREVVFTSGATESNNLAIKGTVPHLRARGDHLVTTAVEHRSVLETFRRLEREGWAVSCVPPDRYGLVTAEAVADTLTERTVLVSVIAASNEVGTINPVAEIAALCRRRGLVFHTDATQAVGKVLLDVRPGSIDLLSLSSHKLYGPKGVGALYAQRGGTSARVSPLFDGGGQERGVRSGTVPVALAVGFGEACAIALRERDDEAVRVAALRDRLCARVLDLVPDVRLNGRHDLRLPGNLNLSFPGVDGEALMMGMVDIAVSSGAACTSSRPEPSHVLLAMGLDESAARASLRFGLGRFTTRDEVDFAAEVVGRVVARLRATGRGSLADGL